MCGCAGAGPRPAPAQAAETERQAQRVFALGENPSDRQIEAFASALGGCYRRAILLHSGAKFSYTMSPDGASVPFSSAVVGCAARSSARDCEVFLDCVGGKYAPARR